MGGEPKASLRYLSGLNSSTVATRRVTLRRDASPVHREVTWMSKRTAVRTLVLLAMNVGIAAPLLAHAQPASEVEISCDAGDSLQTALAALAPGGRIVIRSGTCTGNLALDSRRAHPGRRPRSGDAQSRRRALPVVTVPRGVTATISGVTDLGWPCRSLERRSRLPLVQHGQPRTHQAASRSSTTALSMGDKLKVTRNKGPGITVRRGPRRCCAEASSPQNVTSGEGGGGILDHRWSSRTDRDAGRR